MVREHTALPAFLGLVLFQRCVEGAAVDTAQTAFLMREAVGHRTAQPCPLHCRTSSAFSFSFPAPPEPEEATLPHRPRRASQTTAPPSSPRMEYGARVESYRIILYSIYKIPLCIFPLSGPYWTPARPSTAP